MMRKRVLIFLLLLKSSITLANEVSHRAPSCQLVVKPNAKNLEIIVISPSRYHFNLKAPMSLMIEGQKQSFRPFKVLADQAYFRVPNQKHQMMHFMLSSYLCNEEKTFCEKRVMNASWDPVTNTVKILS